MKKQRMRHARPKLSSAECKALLTDPKVLAYLDNFEARFYGIYANGMPLSGLAKLTLDDEGLAKKMLANIERKIWLAAPKLILPKRDVDETGTKRERSLRLRTGLTVRETAQFLKDERVRKVGGEAEAAFYERYSGKNHPLDALVEYVGTSNAVGVRVYAERIENTIFREALHYKILKQVEPPPTDPDAVYEREKDEEAKLAGQELLKADEEGKPLGPGLTVKKNEKMS